MSILVKPQGQGWDPTLSQGTVLYDVEQNINIGPHDTEFTDLRPHPKEHKKLAQCDI